MNTDSPIRRTDYSLPQEARLHAQTRRETSFLQGCRIYKLRKKKNEEKKDIFKDYSPRRYSSTICLKEMLCEIEGNSWVFLFINPCENFVTSRVSRCWIIICLILHDPWNPIIPVQSRERASSHKSRLSTHSEFVFSLSSLRLRSEVSFLRLASDRRKFLGEQRE